MHDQSSRGALNSGPSALWIGMMMRVLLGFGWAAMLVVSQLAHAQAQGGEPAPSVGSDQVAVRFYPPPGKNPARQQFDQAACTRGASGYVRLYVECMEKLGYRSEIIGQGGTHLTVADLPLPTSRPVSGQAVPSGTEDNHNFDGSYFSSEWKYGFTISNGRGTATLSNSPVYKPGDVILRLTPTGPNSFSGEQICTDGQFHHVTGTLAGNGALDMTIDGCGSPGRTQWKMVKTVSGEPGQPMARTGASRWL